MKRELLALTIVLLILIAFPASLFAYQAWRTWPSRSEARVLSLVGNSPNNGGWQPDTLRVNLGERVRLRISSPDVVHGFEIPALGIKVDEVLPGHVEEVEFTASQVGRFPFACTRWCSTDHWRMRGVLEVVDPANPNPSPPVFSPPLFQQLKIDIDAPHPAQHIPTQRPSAARAIALDLVLPVPFQERETWQTHSPSDLFATLRANPGFATYGDQELWDALALAYERAVGEEAIARGQALFARDCAACHGQTGKGNGTAGRNLPGLTAMHPAEDAAHANVRRGPADFADAAQMLGASDVLLQGKILRGGMGTGMPEWRSLYGDQDMWDVVSYIRSFVLEYEKNDERR